MRTVLLSVFIRVDLWFLFIPLDHLNGLFSGTADGFRGSMGKRGQECPLSLGEGSGGRHVDFRKWLRLGDLRRGGVQIYRYLG